MKTAHNACLPFRMPLFFPTEIPEGAQVDVPIDAGAVAKTPVTVPGDTKEDLSGPKTVEDLDISGGL